jgi:protein-tyrosine-phosphatase
MKLMFIDYDNTLYSQMAQGLAKKFNDLEDLEILSSGLTKGEKLNKELLKVMSDIGIDLKSNKIKHIDDFQDIDILVTLGENVDLMFVPENAKLSWNTHIYKNDLEKTRDVLTKDIKRLLKDIKKNKY